MRFQTLSQWLQWQETLHPSSIELGLERVARVWQRLNVRLSCPLITVAGTNGKGSSVAFLDAIYRAAGYRSGVYTSPHIHDYNERIRLNGVNATDTQICEAFACIDKARNDISLTYFEFGTLAALYCFAHTELDVIILEVGLGGRLDAVNIIDADIALITRIGLDHTDWLGNDRETIGREKAGIMRTNRAAVISDSDCPVTVCEYGQQLGAQLYRLGYEYDYEQQQGAWLWRSGDTLRSALPLPALSGQHQLQNASGVIMVCQLLQDKLPLTSSHLKQGLMSTQLMARYQILPGNIPVILDVAHNLEAVQALADNLQADPCNGRTLAVFAVLSDKPVPQMLRYLTNHIQHWFITQLDNSRTVSVEALQEYCRQQSLQNVTAFSSMAQLCAGLPTRLLPGDRLVVFGSFYTVAEYLSECV